MKPTKIIRHLNTNVPSQVPKAPEPSVWRPPQRDPALLTSLAPPNLPPLVLGAKLSEDDLGALHAYLSRMLDYALSHLKDQMASGIAALRAPVIQAHPASESVHPQHAEVRPLPDERPAPANEPSEAAQPDPAPLLEDPYPSETEEETDSRPKPSDKTPPPHLTIPGTSKAVSIGVVTTTAGSTPTTGARLDSEDRPSQARHRARLAPNSPSSLLSAPKITLTSPIQATPKDKRRHSSPKKTSPQTNKPTRVTPPKEPEEKRPKSTSTTKPHQPAGALNKPLTQLLAMPTTITVRNSFDPLRGFRR